MKEKETDWTLFTDRSNQVHQVARRSQGVTFGTLHLCEPTPHSILRGRDNFTSRTVAARFCAMQNRLRDVQSSGQGWRPTAKRRAEEKTLSGRWTNQTYHHSQRKVTTASHDRPCRHTRRHPGLMCASKTVCLSSTLFK